MTVLAFGNRLTATAWAAEVAKLNLDPRTRTVSRLDHSEEEVEFDLSRARSADFLVLGRLAILIRVLHESGTRVVIRWPEEDPVDDEWNSISADSQGAGIADDGRARRQIARYQRQRINCRLFMDQAGFGTVLETGPMKKGSVESARGTGSLAPGRKSVDWGPHDKPHPPHRQRGMIPYQWINLSGTAKDYNQIVEHIYRAVTNLGLPPSEAAAVTQGVLAELLENARDHGRTGDLWPVWVLVGGELSQPQAYFKRINDVDPHMQEFTDWASKEPSPLLRLFVGDTGSGIKNIEEALEYHATHRHADLYPSGLWRVTRVIRAFQGSITIASGQATGGYIFDSKPEGRKVDIKGRSWLPGTVVECAILTAPGRSFRTYDEELSSPLLASDTLTADLSCVNLKLDMERGLDNDARDQIEGLLAEVSTKSEGGIVVALELPSTAGWHTDAKVFTAVTDVLDIARKAANPGTVTLIFAGVGRRILSLAVDSFNRIHEKQSDSDLSKLQSPILVVSSENTHYWAGGTPRIRKLLSALSKSLEAKLGINEISDILSDSNKPTANHSNTLVVDWEVRDQPRLLRMERGVIELKLRPHDAIEALSKKFNEVVSCAIRRADLPGVERGLFLTSSLRRTHRWVNVKKLLQTTNSYEISGFLLANKVRHQKGLRGNLANARIVRVGSIDEKVASDLSLALSGTAQTFENATALWSSKGKVRLDGDQPIVVCTDLMSKGAYVRKIVRDLWDMGFSRVSTAVLVDGRDLDAEGEPRDFMIIRGAEVPLISLSQVSLDGDPDSDELPPGLKPRPMDPVTGTPLPAKYPHSKTLVWQKDYIDAIEKSGAARLGHIYRSGKKHFTAYVNPSLLFDYAPWRNEVLGRIARLAEKDTMEIIDEGKMVERHSPTAALIYPADSSDDFGRVIYALKDKLDEIGIEVADVIGVPRSAASGQWAFPRFAEIPNGVRHIVAVDPTSKTGRTLRELIRIAAVPGVQFISCFGLIHGMQDLTAMSLQQIREVSTYSPDDPASAMQSQAHVRVRYVARSAVSGDDTGRCQVCALRDSYKALAATLPHRMNIHRNRIVQILDARSKDNVFGELATDLFGVHLKQRDCIEYLTWRSQLEEARFNTANRSNVFDLIHVLAGKITLIMENGVPAEERSETRERNALIRLIAAELDCIDQAPMWFAEIQSRIVEIAYSLLIPPHSLTVDPMLRIQAIIVLAHIDSRLFCNKYAEILALCRDHDTVLAHALVEALKILNRQWINTESRRALVEQIHILLSKLQNRDQPDPTWVFTPLEELNYLATAGAQGNPALPNSRQQAWFELRAFCSSVKMHRYDQAMWRLQRRLESKRKGRGDSADPFTVKDWRQCISAVQEKVLPNLPIIRSALVLDTVVERRLSSDSDQRIWDNVINGEVIDEFNEITVAIGDIFLGEPGGRDATVDIENILAAVAKWNNLFFQSPTTPDNPSGMPVIGELASQCPTDLVEVLHAVFDGSSWVLSFDGREEGNVPKVFCSRGVLIDVLTHIQINAEVTHWTGDLSPGFDIRISGSSLDEVIVEIFNSHTDRSTKGGGHGLRAITELLGGFDGVVEEIEDVPPLWSYGIRIKLERWKWG